MDQINTQNPGLDALFDRYRSAPDSHIFAPLADACRKAGMLEEAIEICDRGVASNSGYTSGHVVRGKCHFDNGDKKTAEECFRRVLVLDEKNLVALKYLGIILAERGDAEQARAYFEDILVLDPDDKEIRIQLEQIETDDEQPSESEPLAGIDDDVIELEDNRDDDYEGPSIALGDDDDVSDELATITLADIYASQGYTDKAVRIYREVLVGQPDNSSLKEKIKTLTGSDDSDSDGDGSMDSRDALDAEVDEILDTATEVSTIEAAPADQETNSADSPTAAQETDSPAPLGAQATAAKPVLPVEQTAPATSRMEEGRSYEQFKRWLRDMAD